MVSIDLKATVASFSIVNIIFLTPSCLLSYHIQYAAMTSQKSLYPSLSVVSWLDPLLNAPYDFGDYLESGDGKRRGVAYLRLFATIDEDDPVEIKMAPFLSVLDPGLVSPTPAEYIINDWLLSDACPTFCSGAGDTYTDCGCGGSNIGNSYVYRTFSIPGPNETCNSTLDLFCNGIVTLFVGSVAEHEYYVKFVSDPAGYSCACDDDRTPACEEDLASKYPWLEDIDRAALRQGCIGEFGDRLFIAGPGTSYSEYPARELTGKSVFADGSFCGQNETEPIANTILLDGKTNFAPPPADKCPCMSDSKYNYVFELLDKGNATVATVTSFRPATSYFDDCELIFILS
jgi:hypothetical protein